MAKNRRLFRSPLLHCLALGALIAWLLAEPASLPSLQLQAQQINEIQRNWQLRNTKTGSASEPSQSELNSLINNAIDNELLYQYARKHHFDQLPPVRQRLLQLADFLQLGEKDQAENRYQQALALGLDKSDPIIRRYMIGAARAALKDELTIAAPDQQAIHTYYLNNSDSFRHPARIKLSHIYIGGFDQQAQQQAEQILSALQQQTRPLEQAIALGDPFYGGHHLPWHNSKQLAGRLGPQFAQQASALAATKQTGEWLGPVQSSYGLHLIWIHQQQASKAMELSQVSGKIYNILSKLAGDSALSQKVRELRADYRIVLPKKYQFMIEAQHPLNKVSLSNYSSEDTR